MSWLTYPADILRKFKTAQRGSIVSVLPFAQKIEHDGEQFYRTGKSIVEFLQMLGQALRIRDFDSLRRSYSTRFVGSSLGLTTLVSSGEQDKIRTYAYFAQGAINGNVAATAEWQSYLSGFENTEELGIHLHRLKQWRSGETFAAVIRFEHIGKLRGALRSSIDRAYFHMSFDGSTEALGISSHSLLKGDRVASESVGFVNVAHDAGLDFKNEYYPAFLSNPLKFGMIRYGPGGITAVDYDSNGLCDLFIPDGVESRLFRNCGDGTFEDVTRQAGLAGLDGVSVAVFGDYDNDGFKDLFVSRTFRPNQLFHNNGDGTFTDVTCESGIGPDSCTTVAAWADYDNDGFLDLYVGRYLDPRLDIPTTFYARNGEPNQLYHNNGDGTFTNVTQRAGVGDTGLCLGVVWGDFNDDGFSDLYVVNDFGRKTLYRNNGNGTFSDITARSNTLAYGAGMSASYADYNNDGKFDFYVTHIRSEHAWFAEGPTVRRYMLRSFTEGTWKTDMPLYMQIMRQSGLKFIRVFQQMASGNTLLRNKGNEKFEDTTLEADANPPGWFWGAVFADFDNDGWQDLYAANGWVYNDKNTEIELDFLNSVVTEQRRYKTGIFFDPVHFGTTSWHGWERNRYLRNNRDGTFMEIGHATGTDLVLNSRGVAVADFWNRGVMDIAVAASDDRHALLKNQLGTGKNWLQVELVGVRSNRDAIGARVTILVNGQCQSREIVAGDSYGSQSAFRLHFGLGDSRVVDKLVVSWPATGIVQTIQNIAVNRIIQITEGDDTLVEKRYPTVVC